MPDVTRTDSQRSDASLRPRVSFNRDVHVKRIVPREGSRNIVGAVSSDGEGHLISSHVRKARLPKDKQQLAKEAAKVLSQVDRVDCVSHENGVNPAKFYTLPARKRNKTSSPLEFFNSLDRKTRRRNSADLVVPPKKPPRTFATTFDDHHQEPAKPKKSNLRRSVSDATQLKKKQSEDAVRNRRERTSSEGDDLFTLSHRQQEQQQQQQQGKKQLSPIIEVTQSEDYFAPTLHTNRNYVDDIVEEKRAPPARKKRQQHLQAPIKNQVIVIDVDKATKINEKSNSKLSTSALGKKLKSLALKTTGKKKDKSSTKPPASTRNEPKANVERDLSGEEASANDNKENEAIKSNSLVREAIGHIQNQTFSADSTDMIHSSQKPVEKLPLTRGRAVDTMVKKLSYENSSPPPPKTNIMITPNVAVQHNNNQPFSYTRPTSPTSPIIYAQVVCGNNGNGSKQTIHTAYANGNSNTKKHLPHSDSDEGLGYEENPGFRSEKTITHFGNRTNYYNNNNNNNNGVNGKFEDKFEEEFPITPTFQTNGYNGMHYDNKMANIKSIYIDSSSRGRGDGMDAKRRESLTETFEKFDGKFDASTLSARRDLLESRITKRFGAAPKTSSSSNVYLVESSTTARYYRGGSTSPVNGNPTREKYVSETKIDRRGSNEYTKKFNGEESRDYRYNGFDNHDPISDYRSSPENNGRQYETSHNRTTTLQQQRATNSNSNKYTPKIDQQQQQQLSKDRNFYKSNPEIHLRSSSSSYNYDNHRRFHQDTYHDSLKRDSCERKDKFGDSGIENDFERRKQRSSDNDSEDEGFASSLLIASERQHTEDNFARKNRTRGYDSDRGYMRDDDGFRNLENMEYRTYKSNKHEYAPRERSIDDGSHFDPRIDKNIINSNSSTLKKVDKKPPKPEKKSSLEKMKQLFTTSKKKKEKQAGMVREESLRARYTEYKGNQGPRTFRKEVNGGGSHVVGMNTTPYDYRRRLSSPSPSPTRDTERKNEPLRGSWFKSLDRLSRKKTKKIEKDGVSTEDETSKPLKSLRFFGDTDQESNDSAALHKPALKNTHHLTNRHRSQSSRDLHNISEESHKPHKSMLNINVADNSDRETRDKSYHRSNLKPPVSPSHRMREPMNTKHHRDERSRRRKNEVSSVESSTEGDSSQQSQRSVVYLHAATVGDIPGPGYLRNGRRAASREELASNSSSRIQPHTKTLSRSFSVLAPWRPKHYKEGMDIDYTQYPKPTKNGKYEQYRNGGGSSRRESSSTLKKKAAETRRSNQSISTLNHKKSRSKENIATTTLKRGDVKGSSSSLYKKKERQPKENNRYHRDDKRTMMAKSMSVESLGSNRSSGGGHRRNDHVSRSISMPRDPEKSAGWFNIKKNKKSLSTHRL